MSASIRVESGISAGTSYWIDRPVLRIGSDPQCEICLPTSDLAPHALTLEFRDGNYRTYNRGSSPVTVGAAVVQPGADGTRSTIKRRVEFNNEEIKLTGPDAELLLGKLVSFNSRQMVLERAGGQVTFVRP